jgi:ribonuclease P protein component
MARRSRDQLLFLRRSAEIERVKKEGCRLQTPLFNLMFCPCGSPPSRPSRIGIVVGRRLGMAVTRNRAKRLFRELSRQVRKDLVAGQDMVVFPRREAVTIEFERLRAAWLSALRQKGLLNLPADRPCGTSSSQ